MSGEMPDADPRAMPSDPMSVSEVTAREFRTLGLQLGYWYEDSPICVPDGTPPPPDDPHDYHASARPGCGPCGMPCGCSVMLPTSMPLRAL